MTTVINNKGEGSGENSTMNLVIGVLLVLGLIVLFFVYALPAIRNQAPEDSTNLDVDVNLPGDGSTNSNTPSGGNGGNGGGNTGSDGNDGLGY